MIRSQECKVVDASSLISGGILETVSTPIDGKDKHLYIGGNRVNWSRERVGSITVQAAYLRSDETPGLAQPLHQLSVNLEKRWYRRKGRGRQANFSLRLLEDGQYGVSTVSGTSAGHAPLGEDQSRIVTELLDQSLGSANVSSAPSLGNGTPTILAEQAHTPPTAPDVITDNPLE